MTILLNEMNASFAYEPLLAALGMIAAFGIVFISIKGKLRDWFMR